MNTYCAYCNSPLPPPVRSSGRPRRFCDVTCRQAAYRERRRDFEPMPAPLAPADGDEALLAGDSADPEARLISALLTASALAAEFMRLGRELPPTLRWRCTELGEALSDALMRYFGDVLA